MIWNLDGALPLYLGLAAEIRTAIIRGIYKRGDKLPGVREFAADAKVNPNTMQRALFELEREGLVKTKGTSGKFVTEDEAVIASAGKYMLGELASAFVARCRALDADRDEVIGMITQIYSNGDDNE